MSSSDESIESVLKTNHSSANHSKSPATQRHLVFNKNLSPANNSFLSKPQASVLKKESTVKKNLSPSHVSRNQSEESLSSSSDSESMQEKRKQAKEKRRVRRLSRNSREEKIPATSPVSNFSGSINSIVGGKKINSNPLLTSSNNLSSKSKLAQVFDNSPKTRKMTPIPKSAGQNLNSSAAEEPKVNQTNNNTSNKNLKENECNRNTSLLCSSTNGVTKTGIINKDLDSTSSSSVTTSSSESDENKEESTSPGLPKSSECDDKVEFSNKDTLKRVFK